MPLIKIIIFILAQFDEVTKAENLETDEENNIY